MMNTRNVKYLLAPTGALVVMMVYYTSYKFLNFDSSIDAIDVTSVTLKSLKEYQCN